jgi:ElaB/YqjD/DUF883 family membrane-anchored ribosome-binding protein
MIKATATISILATLVGVAGVLLPQNEAAAQRNRDDVVVAPLSDEAAETSRTRLEEQLRRYSDRFVTRVTLGANQVRDTSESSDARFRALQWKTVSLSTMVELAIGQDPVTNLLDMMVMTTLSRLVLEDYWLPVVFGESEGAALVEDYRLLEEDIWRIADQVLTPDQQETLRSLIVEWHEENPDQILPWYVRLDEFSGQRAADLQDLGRSGGLLGIRAARESIDEIQAFGERIIFYLQRAPLLTSFALEESIARILRGEEVTSLIDDTERFTTAAEELVAVVAQLPYDQFAAIDQFMLRLTDQRVALLEDLEGSGPQAEAVLGELRRSLEAAERIMVLTGTGGESATGTESEAIDLADYRELAVNAEATARELRLLIEATDELLGSAAWADRESQTSRAMDRLELAQRSMIDRVALAAIGVIAFFFVALLVYRFVAARIGR